MFSTQARDCEPKEAKNGLWVKLLAGLCGPRSWCCRKEKPPGAEGWEGWGYQGLGQLSAANHIKPWQNNMFCLRKHQANKIKIRSKPTEQAAAEHWRGNAPRFAFRTCGQVFGVSRTMELEQLCLQCSGTVNSVTSRVWPAVTPAGNSCTGQAGTLGWALPACLC